MMTCRWIVFTVSMLVLSSCGATRFVENKKSPDAGADAAQLTGDADCFQLGGQPPPYEGNTPIQNPDGGKPYPEQHPCLDDGDKGGYEPNPFPPKGNPGQHPGQNCQKDCRPCQTDCPKGNNGGGDIYQPVDDFYPTQNPTQYPTQHPIVQEKCGKNGNFCGGSAFDPSTWQWPGVTIQGTSYDQSDVEHCLQAFGHAGYDTTGTWGIDVRTIKSVSVLGNDVIEDRSVGPNIVIIKSVGVLGVSRFRFLNPDALYCVKTTNVLNDVRITSCHQQNVVFGKDVNVLSTVNTQTVDCR